MSELLRDLHVELTLATDEGPDSALARAGELLRGLEAEREVVSIALRMSSRIFSRRCESDKLCRRRSRRERSDTSSIYRTGLEAVRL